MGLDGVREAARAAKATGKEVRFTALLHHITPQLLRAGFMHGQRQPAWPVKRQTSWPVGWG
jgi:hypothetical protein